MTVFLICSLQFSVLCMLHAVYIYYSSSATIVQQHIHLSFGGIWIHGNRAIRFPLQLTTIQNSFLKSYKCYYCSNNNFYITTNTSTTSITLLLLLLLLPYLYQLTTGNRSTFYRPRVTITLIVCFVRLLFYFAFLTVIIATIKEKKNEYHQHIYTFIVILQNLK